VQAGESPALPAFAKTSSVTQVADGKAKIEFAVSAPTDVEVAILDAKGVVVRHLAAGVLGAPTPPPAPLKPGLVQSIEWDGRDDTGEPCLANREQLSVNGEQLSVKGGGAATGHRPPVTGHTHPFAVRVRIGMGVKLDKIIGGDPYAFFSSEIQHHNHSLWTIAGIDAKADGSVYVFGTAGQQGPLTVRQYDADGNYIRTVFPFPAGMPVEKISGWGVNRRDDGACAPAITLNQSSWPCYSRTVINAQGGFGPQPVLIPTAGNDILTVAGAFKLDLLTLRTDGTIDPDPKKHTATHLVQEPPLLSWTAWDNPGQVSGGIYICPTPDGKSFFLSGICRIDDKPFWRPGQVWKVDFATRTATPWFALPAEQVAGYDKKQKSYTPLQGVTMDGAGHVFVCDRLNNRVAVLTEDARPVRDLAVANPDDVAWDAEAKALYVTTRFGRQGAPGDVQLLRFDDWPRDGKPALQMKLCVNDMVILQRERTHIRIVGSGAKKRIWIGYKDLPVRIYRENGKELELVRDFYQSGQKLRYLAFRSMVVDPVTDTAFFASGCGDVWKLRDWDKVDFRQCRDAAAQPKSDINSGRVSHARQIFAADVALDSRNRYLFTRQNNTDRVYRWALDGEDHARAPVGTTGSAIYSDVLVMNEWAGSLYFDRGMWPSPDGGMFVLGGTPRINYMDVHLFYHPVDPVNGPGKCDAILVPGPMCGGLRVDRRGRIYLGIRLPGDAPKPPPGFANDWAYGKLMGRIAMYEPTRLRSETELRRGEAGTKERLYPTPLKGPTKIYDVHYGQISSDSSQAGFSPRFGVDDYGRIIYPNTLTRTVALMDNAGNEILRFGTYGNIDDWRALEGRWGEAKSIPLSWPGAVDATDGWIYVADHANVGVLRLAKSFAASETVAVK
jgi:hypothetical protein